MATRVPEEARGAPPGGDGAPPRPVTYGFPAPLWRALAARPLPGPFRDRAWRSPIRGPWLTSVFGLVLLIGLPFVIVTGLLSFIAYQPQFAGNAFPARVGPLHLPYFAWPTHPAWLYRLNQGVHVGLGLALIPVVLAKLWSVIPKLFTWPPVRSLAHLVERASLLLLVGSVLFEFVTGVLNIQYDYVFGFDFYTAHYFGAWIFIGAFVVHVAIKFPTMRRSLRTRRLRDELRTDVAHTVPEPLDVHGLVAVDPAPPTASRRGVLAAVAGGSLLVTLVTVGARIGGAFRGTAVLDARGRAAGSGANHFPVNRTATAAQVTAADTGTDYRLALTGPTPVRLSRAQLLAMPQYTVHLPIACVEGWATGQTWTGVRLRDLALVAGVPSPRSAQVRSLEKAGAFARATLNGNQVTDPHALLALKVNGEDLALDHGYPARVIVPAVPGVHNTKWVSAIEFTA
ncbi:MAG TPA: molybdopterin-dependent oxidoreductase [Frankiaceae bacterium]